MSHQRYRATNAVHHTARPRAGNGEARPNGCKSPRRDARDGTEPAKRHARHVICPGFRDAPICVSTAAAASVRLHATFNPHRHRCTA